MFKALLAAVFEDEFNRGGEAFQTFFAGLSLPVGFRHLRAESDEPLAIPLDNGRVAVSHVHKLPGGCRTDNLKSCRVSLPLRTFLCLFILAASFCLHASAQSYSIDWSTIDGGGGTSTGGVYSITGTIGQPDAGGAMTNGQYSVTGGFWSLYAVQTPGAPTLNIVPASPGFATVSWTPPSTNWVLQENLNLGTTNWVNSVSGATNPIVVPATVPKKFYRLFKP